MFPQIDLDGPYKETYVVKSYNNNYNSIRNFLAENISSDEIFYIDNNDIDPNDRSKIHATVFSYRCIAKKIKKIAEQLGSFA